MKTLKLFKIASVAFTMGLLLNQSSSAETPVIQIKTTLQPDPLIVNGMSGEGKKSDCGIINAASSQIIQVTEPLPYLRLTVESKGQPTLLIDGPGGRFCILSDNLSGGKPELSGFWQAGKYSVSVGQLSQEQHGYSLTISQKKQALK